MPIRHRLAAGTGVVAIAAAIALAGSAPASAHSGTFYTSVDLGDANGFATISSTDAAVVTLPTVSGLDAEAVEIWNELGYAIAGEGEGNDTLYFWDHTTGAVTGSAPLTLDPAFSEGAELLNVYALDTTKGSSVPDGTILTFAEINFGEEANQGLWLSSIDSATGIVTPLVDITGLDATSNLYIDSLATDPISGVTYALVDFNDGVPQYSVLDIAAGTFAVPVPLAGVSSSLGLGYMWGADFTDAGLLHFFYNSTPEVFAHLTGAITSNPSAVLIGIIDELNEDALAYDPAPQLADTGFNALNPAIAALALLGFGGAVVVISRRRLTA